MPGKFVHLDIEEISSVDHPANRRKYLVVKRASDEKDITKEAMTPDEILAHDEAVDKWWNLWSAFMRSVESIMFAGEGGVDTGMLRTAVDQFASRAQEILVELGDDLTKSATETISTLKGLVKGKKPLGAESLSQVTDLVKSLQFVHQEGDTTMTEKELQDKVAALQAANEELAGKNTELQATIDKANEPTDPEAKRKAALAKMDPETRALFEEGEITKAEEKKASEARLAKAEAQIKAERDERLKQEAIVKAQSFQSAGITPDDHATLIAKMEAGEALTAEERELVYTSWRSAGELAKQSGVFKELGSNGDGDVEGTAAERVQKLAKAKMDAESGLTLADATRQVLREDPVLYRDYRKETQVRV